MPVGPPAERFDIVSIDRGRTHNCNISVVDQEYLFWNIETSPLIFSANQWTGFYMKTAFVMKGLSWNLVLRLIRIWMYNSMAVFTFSVLDGKHPFWANLVQKIKIVSFSWNLVPRLIQICRVQWWCSLFVF